MSRSVSYANGSVLVNYIDCSWTDDSGSDWSFFISDLTERLKEDFKSLSDCDKFLGREDLAILENNHCYIGVSEYCGLVSLWIVPKDDNNLANNWISLIEKKFKSYGELNKIATFSNGESVYQKNTEMLSSNGSRW